MDDLAIWDVTSQQWAMPTLGLREGVKRPAARFAHLSIVDSLFVGGGPALYLIGGETSRARAAPDHLRDLAVLDLESMCWVHTVEDVGRKCGAHRSVVAGETVGFVGRARVEGLVRMSYSKTREQMRDGPTSLLVYSNSDLKSDK